MDNATSEPQSDKKRKKDSPLFYRMYTAWFLLLFLLCIITISVFSSNPGIWEEFSATSGENMAGFTCDLSEAQKLVPYAGGVIKLAPDYISYISTAGAELYGIPVMMKNPKAVINGDYVMIYDAGGFTCVLADTKGVVFQKQLAGEISFACVSKNGISAVITEKINTKGTVDIIDTQGNTKAEWESRESGFPVNAVFSGNSSILNITYVNTDALVPQANLNQLLINNKSGELSVSEWARYKLPGTDVFPLLATFSENAVFTANSTHLVNIYDSKMDYTEQGFAQIYSMYPVKNDVVILYADGIGQQIYFSRVENMTMEGKTLLGNNLIDSDVWDIYLLAAIDGQLIKLNTSTGEVLSTLPMDKNILRVGFLNANTAVVVTENGVQEIGV